ncbi:hypothetical protein BJ546DRAFT_308918 [Cryomyces antarcticus]
MTSTSRRISSFLVRLALALGSLLFLRVLWTLSDSRGEHSFLNGHTSTQDGCLQIPGLEDVLVVFKTGATEALDKLPIHFHTTLRCVPHYIIYSDFEEEIAGHQVYDALDEVDEETKSANPDFRLYNRLRRHGRHALSSAELAEWAFAENNASGNNDNPGWRLDKWKFLPLVDKALRHRPEARWYIFMEADTYFIWSSLLEWLAHFDSSKPHYIGERMQTGSVVFAYGGSGFIISNRAMRMVSGDRKARLQEYDKYTQEGWAGDAVLGWALSNVGVGLSWSWPNLQGKRFSELDHAGVSWSKRLWCYYAVSYHHVSSSEIESLYGFEKEWARNASSLLRHSDVFKKFILPQIQREPERDNWSNLSDVSQKSINSTEECRAICEDQEDCMQFSYSLDNCRMSTAVRLEHSSSADNSSPTVHSGWIVERIGNFVRDMEPCNGEGWVLS